MYVKLNSANCYRTAQFDSTKEWFLEFESTKQIDRLIQDLKTLKEQVIKRKQEEFDRKHQLSLLFT